MLRYAYGTKENIRAEVKDSLGLLATVDRAFITIWSIDPAGQLVTKYIDRAGCGVSGMLISYLLDTTALGGVGKYKVLIEAEIDSVSEKPATWFDITIDRKEDMT
jgi:hypothetical protein